MGVMGTRRALLLAAAATALAVPSAASAATPFRPLTVTVGGGNPRTATDLDSYYPRVAVVRAGSRIRFTFQGFHTVTFNLPRQRTPEAVAPIGGTYPAENDPAGAPFWWSAAPVPQLGFNPKIVLPSRSKIVDGRHYVNSGLPFSPNAVLTALFPKRGVYRYFCGLHPNMSGVVRVVGRRAATPPPAAQNARGRVQQATDTKAAMSYRAHLKPPANTVLVGPGKVRFTNLVFAPRLLTVKAGTVVRFQWAGREEAHTVTFGPPAYLMANARRDLQRPPFTFAAINILPSEPPGQPVVYTGATHHGNGFLNSGFMFDPTVGPPGSPHSYSVQFPTPGSYSYVCLIHPDTMRGTINVAP